MGLIGAWQVAAGHELCHYRHPVHKIVGNLPYTMFFQSHFWSEHTMHHHKMVATDEDPSSAKQGLSMFQHVRSAIVGTHVDSWNLEIKRLTRLNGGEKPSTLHTIIYNRMVGYTFLHLAMVAGIHQIFGMGGVVF